GVRAGRFQAGDAGLGGGGKKLQSGRGTRPRRSGEADERTAIAGGEVILVILGGFIERAADCDAAAVATSTRKANPVRVRWRLASIAPGLKRAAGIGDDVACVENSLRHPRFRDGQLAGRTLLAQRP